MVSPQNNCFSHIIKLVTKPNEWYRWDNLYSGEDPKTLTLCTVWIREPSQYAFDLSSLDTAQ